MGSQDIAIQNIKRLMRARGWSGNRLADFSGISRTYMAALLRGQKRAMTLPILDKIAEALEVQSSELILKRDSYRSHSSS